MFSVYLRACTSIHMAADIGLLSGDSVLSDNRYRGIVGGLLSYVFLMRPRGGEVPVFWSGWDSHQSEPFEICKNYKN